MVQDQQHILAGKHLQLSEAKRALLEKRLRGTAAGHAKTQIIPKHVEQELAPLSVAQKGLWFLDQLAPQSSLYNISTVLRLSGWLNIEALQQSINEIVQRHSSLRTTFISIDNQPMQSIAPMIYLELPVIDLSATPTIQHDAKIYELAYKDAKTPFDLQRLPLIRTTLLRLASDEHVLLLTIHHIVSDGWSTAILRQELATLYASHISGEYTALPELPIQFVDYALWEREYLRENVLENLLTYWKKQLAGSSHFLDLPTDRPRPEVQTFRGARHRTTFAPTLTRALRVLSQREGVTLFMLLLAAFQTMLYRYTGQEDILVGSPIANRKQRETEGIIGYFLNTLVLRTSLEGDPTFQELLQRVSKVTLDAYTHQDLPFPQLVNELQIERDPSRAALVQVIFVLQNTPVAPTQMADVDVQEFSIDPGIAKFDLTLDITELNDALTVAIEYNTDLFDAATIERMQNHFRTLLEGVIAHPEQTLSKLPLLTGDEKQQLLKEHDTTHIRYPVEHCLHTLFEAQVAKEPEAPAVVYEGHQLSYRELDQRANQLAHHLQSLGVGSDTLVGLYMERSLELVVALLAILKAGGAYVPIDPNSPAERLAFMLQDAHVPVLLTQQQLVHTLPPLDAHVFCLDSDWEQVIQESQQAPTSNVTGDNLAYVIYTSGSTGLPKGVMVSHFNVMRLFAATDAWYHFDKNDVWTLFHSYAFDFSVWELWGALLYGGRLVVVPYLISRSPEEFYNLLCTEHVTVLNQTPSAFRQLIHVETSLANRNQLSLRLVIFGGEALELQMLKPWVERHGDQRPQLVNMYGITETTVHVTYRPLTITDIHEKMGSVIGGPIPDLQVYVLDQHRQLVPIGVSGELYIGGAGVARGYLNRPELTNERFISDPFSTNPHARLYKSGDLVRYLPGGDIEYSGRIDHQVKIRGFRIELGEIEAIVAQHSSVRDAVVIAREDARGTKQLVAYLTTNGTVPTISDLRQFLRKQLPEYMLPSVFVFMESLPLTTNGKTDRRALPAPDMVRSELDQAFVAPRTLEERMLADIWSQVLGIAKVGVYDNFFVSGGDSIRSIQVLSMVRERGYDISLTQLLQYQTIGELVQELRSTPGIPVASAHCQPFELVSSDDRSRLANDIEDAYPLTRLQAGMFFHSEFQPDSTLYSDTSSEHVRAPFELHTFQKALQELALRHPMLRTSFDFGTFSEPLQLVHRSVTIPLLVEDLRAYSVQRQEEIVHVWFEAEKQQHFDWTRAPLLRMHVHRRSDTTFQLGFSEHHAILDGWSVATMLTELFLLYFTLLGNDITVLEPAPVSTCRDFVALEQEALSSEVSRSYWLEALADYQHTPLPHRTPPLPLQEPGHFALLKMDFPLELTEQSKQLARAAQVPLKSVLLAAHLRIVALISGQSDIVSGLVCNGRLEEADSERVLGLFLNTVPLRMHLHGGSWLELIRATFDAEQALLAHRRYPLAEIQQQMGGQPLFDSAFNYVHFHVLDRLHELKDFEMIEEQSYTETNFPFTAELIMDVTSSQLHLHLEYHTSVLSDRQAEAIGGYYTQVLQVMVIDPTQEYETVPLLSAHERQLALGNWSRGTALAPEPPACLHHLFEAQVTRTPEGIAVIYEGQQLSYRELDERANQLAHHLQQRGVGPDVLVGLSLQRSLDLVVALLGILKAGGAYVPLDPEYPAERLAFMLQDTRVSMLLTSQTLVSRLPLHTIKHIELLCLDEAWPLITLQSNLTPTSGVVPEHLAYVIYTSGSTGQPKGVMISHRSLAAFARAAAREYHLEYQDRVLQFTSLSWDTSVEEIYPCLTHGATLVLRPSTMLDSTTQFLQSCRDLRVSILNLPTAYWQALTASLEYVEAPFAECLRLVIIGGEKVLPEQVARWQKYVPTSIQLANTYGVAEGTVEATCYSLSPGTDIPSQEIPIGSPFCGSRVYLLDEHQQPVPVGVAGELHLGGVGIAHGYLHRPALTAERFVPDPFTTETGQRLYKTGDMARYRIDGILEYVGRQDNQVKIRGYRIEVAEIETVLTQHPAINEAVVLARDDAQGNKQLIAYLVSKPGESPAESDVRRFLSTKLPTYMVPSHFMVLKALPLTTNGKVNRQHLPPPDQKSIERQVPYIAPRDEIELQLVQIWEDVLDIHPIGVRDDFFESGGHSLLALRLMSLIHHRFERDFSLSMLFNGATIEDLAAALRAQPVSQPTSPLVMIQSGGTKTPFFCVHPVGGNVLCYTELARQLGQDQPFYGLQAIGLHEHEEPLKHIEDMARQYVETLRTIQPHGPYILGGWSLGGTIAFEMALQLLQHNQQVTSLILLDSIAPGYDRDTASVTRVPLLEQFMLDLVGITGMDLVESRDDFLQLDPDQQLNTLLNHMKTLHLIAPEIELVQMRRYLQVYQANVQAENAYRPAIFPNHITLFRASEQGEESLQDETMGWRKLAKGSIDIFSLPGNHYTLLKKPFVQLLAECLSTNVLSKHTLPQGFVRTEDREAH